MDDTLWVAENKPNLQTLINIASSFYKMTGITVNLHKSILATNYKPKKDNKPTHISFNNTNIHPIPPKHCFRFLGCYYNIHTHKTTTQQNITKEIEEALKLLQKSTITEKQAIYIINTVILTRFEYRTQNFIYTQPQCDKLTNKYTSIAKHKAGMSKAIPNSTLYNHRIYALRTLWNIQCQHHISKITQQINDPDLCNSSLYIHIQQLQNAANTNTSILVDPLYILPTSEHNTTTAKRIQILHDNNFTIINNISNWPKPLPNKGNSINKILLDPTLHTNKINVQQLKTKLN